MSRNSKKPTYTIKEFPGLLTTDDPFEVSYKGLVVATNVDVTRNKKVKRRKGSTQLLAIANIQAAASDGKSLLFTVGGDLRQLNEDMTVTTHRSDMSASNNLCLKTIGSSTYYSNGIETGLIYNGSDQALGIIEPKKPTLAVASYGDMHSGRYQVALTYIRDDGLESGSGVPALVILPNSDAGITISYQASTDPRVVAINIYCTRPDGTELFFAMSVSNATGSSTYSAHPNFLRRALRTQFKENPPAFNVIEMGRNNRMMYAHGSIVTMSDPYAPEHISSGESYMMFPSTVTMLGAVEAGTFVGTEDNTYFVKGNTFETTTMDVVAPYGAVLGTRTYIDGSLLGEGDVSDILPAWMSKKGMCVGQANGSVQNVTQTSVDIPRGLRGSSMFRQEDGQNHIISVIQK